MCKLITKFAILFSLSMALIFALAADTYAQKKKNSSRSGKLPIPSITAEKIRNDIIGETIYAVPSEETGQGWMNWQFSYSQPRQIEILQRESYGNESTIEARIYAQRAGANFDGPIDRLKGVARLYYRLSGGRWQLKEIESISLRHSGILSGSSFYNSAPVYQASAAILPGGVTVSVPPGKFKSYSFRVANRAIVSGRFRASGGAGNDIEVYILDEDGFLNWSNNHGSPALYNSGRLTVGTIKTPLNAGTYYLVFNNTYSPADTKTVEVTVDQRNDNVTNDGFGQAYDSYGRVVAVNRVSRAYPYNVPPPYSLTPNPPVRTRADQPSTTLNSAVAGISIERILAKTFEAGKRSDVPFPFVLSRKGTVKGSFRVLGGGEKDIEVFIMTAAEYNLRSDPRMATINYGSGKATNGTINLSLDPGAYYLVFSNRLSSKAPKSIEAKVSIEYPGK